MHLNNYAYDVFIHCILIVLYFLQLLPTFNEMYEERAKRDHYNTTNQAYKLYDVMWALALALNSTDAMIKGGANISETGCDDVPGSIIPLEMFEYSNKKLGCLIQWNIQRTNFSGLTVSVIELSKLKNN